MTHTNSTKVVSHLFKVLPVSTKVVPDSTKVVMGLIKVVQVSNKVITDQPRSFQTQPK